MRSETGPELEKDELELIAFRLTELNNTATQALIFLSFAIVAAVTFYTPGLEASRRSSVSWALRWWIGAIFPTVVVIIPLKEIMNRKLAWYSFVLWLRFVLLWAAIVCIFVGAIYFFKAI
jgi:hypothetical protein